MLIEPSLSGIVSVRSLDVGSSICDAVLGNTSAASIPLVLSESWHERVIKKGDVILTPAVGGGFYWGGLLFRL